jgi:hypothetical protein
MKKIYVFITLIAATGLTACQSDDVAESDGSRTPIEISASVNTDGTATTRAGGEWFTSGDQVVIGFRNSASTDYASPWFKQTTFTVAADNISLSSPVLYWDDFSSTDKDLKVGGGKTLDLLYGVCLNGVTATITDAGTFDWAVQTDQKNLIRTSDLLLNNAVLHTAYSRTASERAVAVQFKHVMSQVTINLTASTDDGYNSTTDNFASTAVTLQGMNTTCHVDAQNLTTPLTNLGGSANVAMRRSSKGNTKATYQAIVVPGKALTDGTVLAIVEGVNGNTYNVNLTTAILGDASTAGTWAANLADGGAMKPGVNYVLNVTLKKQSMSITATVADWTNTTAAEANGIIHFTADGTTQGTTSATETAFAKAFTVYSNSAATDAGYTAGSLFTNNGNVYTTNIPMYWAGNDDSRYFRTSIYSSSTATAEAAPAITEGKVSGIIAETYADNKDLLWGTNGDFTYKATSTEAVKMHFSHALAKIKVTLETSQATDVDYVDLTNVDHIAITNVQTTGGVMSLHTGAITSAEPLAALTLAAANTEYLVLPQSIGATSVLVVTMKDGTTFSTNMNTGLSATSWLRGTQYTYTVTIKKTAVTFSAQIQNWSTSSSSGTANMDWD